MNHLNERTLVAYAADEIADAERLAADAHLATCEECIRRVHALLALRESFAQVWMNWTAEEHGRIVRQLQLLKALESGHQPLSARAIQWLGSIAEGAELAVKVLLSRGERIAGIAARVVPEQFQFEFRPVVAGVGSPADEALLDRKIAEGSAALIANHPARALGSLREVSHINAMAVQSASSVIYRENRKYAEVVVDARRGSLLVKHWPVAAQGAEFVLLLPSDPVQFPALGTFAPVGGEDYLLAAFDEFPDGACDLIIGPAH
jgi:hypothetical protein